MDKKRLEREITEIVKEAIEMEIQKRKENISLLKAQTSLLFSLV